MAFMTEMPDPLEPLRAARVPDEIVRPLAELLRPSAATAAPSLNLAPPILTALEIIEIAVGGEALGLEQRLQASSVPPTVIGQITRTSP
jgi:hypothetical protein